MTAGAPGWLRALLAVGLLAGFYVVAGALLIADAVVVGLALWMAVEQPHQPGSWALTVGGGIPAAYALVHGIVAVSRAEERPPGAVRLRRREAPALWRLVEDLARRSHTRPPGRIYLTAEADAAVSEHALFLGLAAGERTLYLGVPLLTGLTSQELRAVLCHELGHYAGRHTTFGAIAYRGEAALRSALFRLRMTADAGRSGGPGLTRLWLFQAVIRGYARLYLRLSLAVRRRQELEADAWAVALVGPVVTARALRAVHALGITWAAFVEGHLRPVQRLGFVPRDVFGTFAALLDDPLVRRRTAELRAHPVEAVRSPLDSHPPLARRLALIEARSVEGSGVPAGPPPFDDLPLRDPSFSDRAATDRVQRRLLAAGGSTTAAPLPWPDWADLAAETGAIDRAAGLLEAASDLGTTARPAPGDVLDLLARGRGAALARRITDAPEPEEHLVAALYAVTGQALVDAGRARWALDWVRGPRLECPYAPDGQLAALVAAAVRDRAAVSALRAELLRLGADVDAPTSPVPSAVTVSAGRAARVRRSGGRAPEPVLRELGRQRKATTLTVGVVLAVTAVWGVALVHSDPTQPVAPPHGTPVRPGPHSPQHPPSWAEPTAPPSLPPLLPPSPRPTLPGLGLGTPSEPVLRIVPVPVRPAERGGPG
ncbi:M48 family metalloprotease [Streptomyces sp. LE64]|uniref:M48 family metalloprotease n=1 Tax=Streptomyces sp. LE64 TaxID=3448653 RepID=UPI004042D370